ncbi:helix-turn-helix domain-containing protein [Antrihabitans spumae]|jgi:ribosome-binding protein aMBF1 (putative translation factor)|uniref:Helix-turn-helix domain-containing protein n=1 Tax=Antrihabitans spumae TaxID=3373370 RepID=A0ABW7JJZ0_9NOCA
MTSQRRLTLVTTAPDQSDAPATPEPAPLVRELYGRVIREERGDQDRSLDDVATQVGMSKQYLSEIERGKKEPSSEILRSICGALGISIEDLLTRSSRRGAYANRTTRWGTPTLQAA